MEFNKINKHSLLVCYKLLYDTLALLLATFGGLILLNGLLPEFFLQSSIFLKIILLMLLNISAIANLGNFLKIDFPVRKAAKHPLIPVLLVFIFLVTGNALLKLKLWENILLTFSLVFVLYQYFVSQTRT